MSELWQRTATELAAGIRSGDHTATEALESVLERVDERNPHLNAITYDCRESARVEAAVADAAVAEGAELGPLHGVPVTIKENVDQAGTPNTNGVPAFADLMASEDAPLVSNLRNAGAVIFGRTNTPEFSMRATTDNPLRGRTRNPWDDEASPGGSSGGAGSACAAGMGPLHHGNDIGGSLRFPAFANGTTTVKPSSFRVPVFNATATAERALLSATMSCQGIIARTAADVRLATTAMIARDPRDPNHVPLPWDGPAVDGPVTVAVTTESNGYDMHPAMGELVERSAEMLADAGYRVVHVDPPSILGPAKEWFRAGITELNVSLGPAMTAYGSETIQRIFEWYYDLGEILDRNDYMQALGDRARYLREWSLFLDKYPLLVTPFLMRPLYDWNDDAQSFALLKDVFDSSMYSSGTNYLGLPAGVFGVDLVEGRPAAVQIVGRRYREDLIVDAMEAVQERNGILTDQLWAPG
ncbi:MAG: amidase [Acidimicrobiales bacterium]|nr:amidase [Acidimicrobiales bacterium]MDG1876536.1 amidase [Acidimicrobiales bacterium]